MREVDSLLSSSSTITATHQPSESSSTTDDSTTDAWSSEDLVECYHQINQLSRVEGLKRYINLPSLLDNPTMNKVLMDKNVYRVANCKKLTMYDHAD